MTAIATAFAPPAALPLATTVQCLSCKVLGPSSLIPDIGWGPRCADIKACTDRFAEGGLPKPLAPFGPVASPSPAAEAEPAPVLDEDAERSMARFEALHDAQDSAAAEDPGPGEDETTAPAPTQVAAPAPDSNAGPVPVAPAGQDEPAAETTTTTGPDDPAQD